MTNVALWSKFPSRFVTSKIVPKLEKRGIHVLKLLSPRTEEVDLTTVDSVLQMHEMSSHSETIRLKILATSQSKPVYSFSRKESHWNRDLALLGNLENNMNNRSINPEKLNDFCKIFVKLRKEGVKTSEMIPSLSCFWERGELTNAGQLQQYVMNVFRRPDCPQVLKDYYKDNPRIVPDRAKDRNAKKISVKNVTAAPKIAKKVDATQSTKKEVKLDSTPTQTPEKVDSAHVEQKVSAPVVEKSEYDAMEALYQEENRRLMETNRKLKEELETLKSKTTTQNSKLDSVLRNVVESFQLNLETKDQAFDRILKFLDSKK